MIYALLLLASLANAQEVSTGAATSLLDEVRISNLGKDTRDLFSGRYRQTGKPTFANGFCFADATCQTTAATVQSGLLQFVSSTTTAGFTLSGSIPGDNTTPQISEGGQVLVATMTPTNAASNIKISGVVNLGETTNNCNTGALCLFKNSGAGAIACWLILTSGTPDAVVPFFYTESASNTTERNYSLRAGCEVANTLTVNRGHTGISYGGSLTSYMEIVEISQ